MTAGFSVKAPPSFARTLEALAKRHPELVELYTQALRVAAAVERALADRAAKHGIAPATAVAAPP